MRCGQVLPFWVHLGYVKWSGTPEREKLYCIEYRRCKSETATHVHREGFVYHLCDEHA